MNNEDTNKLIQVGTLDKPEWIEARRRVIHQRVFAQL